jgi:hydrogenase small subunit
MMALPPTMTHVIAAALEQARRPSVIWLSFQECTGCTESLTRSHSPTVEDLILDVISLDYHHTLQAASGEAAEEARLHAMKEHFGEYLVVVDGSLPGPDSNPGYSTIAGFSNYHTLMETLEGAAAVVAVGTCAAFGGLPMAAPNTTGAKDVAALMREDSVAQRPLVNLPGCPPVPMVITGVLAQYLTFGKLPELDGYKRPLAFFGQSIHDRCYRRPFYDKGLFAETFDDEGARQGWCLLELGCRGPVTHNACPTLRWNRATSYPIAAGHPCIGCSEPDFWDRDGFYGAIEPDTVPSPEEAATPEQRGAAVFDDNCVYCHLPSRKPFRTPAEEVPELLRRSGIRAHRFDFTDAQLADLVHYLETLEAAQ